MEEKSLEGLLSRQRCERIQVQKKMHLSLRKLSQLEASQGVVVGEAD
tara:strand:- start:367 stop:507 length:141 start_codon:yes stop_codon:yes gene_type:complete